MSSIRYHIAAAIVLISAVALNVPNLSGQSPTADEYAQVPAGYSYLVKGDFRLYPKNPPLIKMILALPLTAMSLQFPLKPWLDSQSAWGPWYFADKFAEANPEKKLKVYFWARMMNLLLGLILGLTVYLWTNELYGPRPALAATAFTATSPTMLAHAGVATVDVGFALFFILALYAFYRAFHLAVYTRVIVAGIFFGAAQLSKFTAVILIPILFFTSAAMAVINLRNRKHIKDAIKPSVSKIIMSEVVCLALIFLIGLAIVHAGYFFRDGVNYLGGSACASKTARRLSATTLGRVPILLPEEYVRGMDMQLADAERGEFPNYLNGKWRRKGAPYYFLEALGLKETIPGLIFVVFGAAIAVFRHNKDKSDPFVIKKSSSWPFVHLPAILFFVAISLIGNLQLGVRYAAPLPPLLFIIASRFLREKTYQKFVPVEETDRKLRLVKSDVVEENEKRIGVKEKIKNKLAPIVVIALFGWQCAEVLGSAPSYISYFNEIAGGAKGGARYLLDSNIDWGQDLPALKKTMDKNGIKEIGLLYFGHANPSWYGIKWRLPEPDDKYVAVSVNFLHGYPYSLSYLAPWEKRPPMITDPEFQPYRNLATALRNVPPKYVAGGSIYVFDLSPATTEAAP